MKKVFCIILSLLALVTAAYGQSFLENIHLSLNKGFEGVYAKGDTIKVFAEVDKETPALVKIYQNGYFKQMRETLLPAGKSEVFRGSYDEATALMFRLADHDNKEGLLVEKLVLNQKGDRCRG